MLNKTILMGRLTKDPELKYTPNGVAVTTFSIAVNRRFAKEGQQQADFINCVAWRQQAEFICKHFRKGNMIAIMGSIQTRSWEKEGSKIYATDIAVDEVYFTGSKQEQRETPSDMEQGFSQDDAGDDFTDEFADINYDDEDLPF